MGDVVHALPLVTDLAAHVPGAQIDWLVEESFAAIPSMSRHVHRVHRVALRRWRHALLRDYFCPGGAPLLTVDGGIDALKRGRHSLIDQSDRF